MHLTRLYLFAPWSCKKNSALADVFLIASPPAYPPPPKGISHTVLSLSGVLAFALDTTRWVGYLMGNPSYSGASLGKSESISSGAQTLSNFAQGEFTHSDDICSAWSYLGRMKLERV